MSQYDIIFSNSLATQNLLWQPPNPTYPTSESSSIQDVQTQGSGLGKSLYQSDMPQTICTTTCPACSRQRLSRRGADLGAVDTQPSSPLPASPLPELSAQAWVDWFPELFPQRNWIIYDKREWDARILWEMAQPGYQTHPGRAFGGNTLGWNFQVTKASYDVMPLHTNNYLQNGRLFGSVGYWNPEKEAITFNGWNYKVSSSCHYLFASLTVGSNSIPDRACFGRHRTRGLR